MNPVLQLAQSAFKALETNVDKELDILLVKQVFKAIESGVEERTTTTINEVLFSLTVQKRVFNHGEGIGVIIGPVLKETDTQNNLNSLLTRHVFDYKDLTEEEIIRRSLQAIKNLTVNLSHLIHPDNGLYETRQVEIKNRTNPFGRVSFEESSHSVVVTMDTELVRNTESGKRVTETATITAKVTNTMITDISLELKTYTGVIELRLPYMALENQDKNWVASSSVKGLDAVEIVYSYLTAEYIEEVMLGLTKGLFKNLDAVALMLETNLKKISDKYEAEGRPGLTISGSDGTGKYQITGKDTLVCYQTRTILYPCNTFRCRSHTNIFNPRIGDDFNIYEFVPSSALEIMREMIYKS